MRNLLVILSGLLCIAATISAKDTDNDGVPDELDRAPRIAQYYNNQAVPSVDPATQPPSVDSDNDGVADCFDRPPHVAQYYQGYAGERIDPAAQPPSVDSDNDGVPDSRDRRPHVAQYYRGWAGDTKPIVAVKKRTTDSDGDGVIDDDDKCPATPQGVSVDASGCPVDSDGDRVADYIDACPGTPAGVMVDARGCPADADADGVYDGQDKCPGTPAGVTVDMSGCPLDGDGDGVADYLDKCPGTPAGIPVDATGCPKIIQKGEKITLNVNFATNSAEFDDASRTVLAGVGKTLVDFPDIKVAIRGFTDNTGSESHNRQLSDRRAKSVMAYLVELGVDKGRITAKGFGEDPKYFIGDNNTEEGRAQNRRVELESVE
jgi:OmpA-OmpF porin, OOP family